MYRLLLGFGGLAIVILVVGVAEFVYFEPPGQATGSHAHIVGVFAYDPASGSTSGLDSAAFRRTQPFAAVVDWSTLPSNITVDARWVNGFGESVGSVGPATPDQLSSETVVAVRVPEGLTHNLPGHYIFVVERLRIGQPVEVLARRIVLVERS